MHGDEHNDFAERLREAERRVFEHPAHIEMTRCDAFRQTLLDVFRPNLAELATLLKRPEVDENLAVELMQNVHRADVRQEFTGRTLQRLHNYVAATMTLVEHSRRLMRQRSGPIVGEFERRKAQLLDNLEVPFIQDLRNFTLHRSLPMIQLRVRLPDAGAPDQRAVGAVELPVDGLTAWDRWTAPSLEFLRSQGNAFLLLPVIEKHSVLVFRLNAWLHDALSHANEPGLREVNRLVVERNAVLSGRDVCEAERITQRLTELRNQPPSSKMTVAEYHDAVFGGLRPDQPEESTPDSSG